MADNVSAEVRRQIMKRVRSRDTDPEIAVRKFLHRSGYRFRLHVRSLPGTPDIVLKKHNTIVFVHGCFWHSQPGCPRAKLPASNTEFWKEKIRTNAKRDSDAKQKLEDMGWKVLVIWGCETSSDEKLDFVTDLLFTQEDTCRQESVYESTLKRTSARFLQRKP